METSPTVNIPNHQEPMTVVNTRKCRICGQVLHISQFEKYGNKGYHTACKACEGKEIGENEALKDFTSAELIQELRVRGYKGKLQQVIVKDIVIL